MTSRRLPLDRRSFLAAAGAVGAVSVLAACGSGSGDTASTDADPGADTGTAATSPSADTAAPDAAGSCLTPPTETAGPFPGDGSNDNGAGEIADVLADSRAVRRDIRSNLDGSDTQPGTPMTLTMTVNDSACSPLAGAAVYVWHCSRDGSYSMYGSRMNNGDQTDATWLRGVQITDASGTVSFDTILPGRYSGRAAHIHFEVYADGSYDDLLLTSQLAFDDTTIDGLYEAAGYADSLRNSTSNSSDRQFSDGVDEQQLTVDGDITTGLAASIIIAI